MLHIETGARNTARTGEPTVNEYFLGNPPSWMMRYGISVMAAVVTILLGLAYFVHYPDVMKAEVVITTSLPPVRIVSKSGGRVAELLVTDREYVAAGSVLAVVENTCRWRDVLRLESWLNDAQHNTLKPFPANLQMGELQDFFSVYHQRWQDVGYFMQHNGVEVQVGHLLRQITGLERIGNNLEKQIMTQAEEFALAEKEYHRQEMLYHDGVIADKTFEVSKAQFLSQKRAMENMEAAVLQNMMRIGQLEAQINDLRKGLSDQMKDKELALAEDRQRLISAIARWKQEFLIIAPVEGRISFTNIQNAQQTLSAGEEVLAIVPTSSGGGNSGHTLAWAMIPTSQAGLIVPGQKAIIHIDGYPARHYGSLETKIADMSLVPQKDGHTAAYRLEMYLPDTLITSLGKHIPFRQEMTGGVRIITEDRRVLERILGRLRDLIHNP
jgi:multidrug resistance efflux pump